MQRRFPLKYKFQFRLVRRTLLPLLLFSLIASGIIIYATDGQHEYSMTSLRWMGLAGIACLWCASVMGVAWSLMLYSSRLAGPLIHLEKVLKQISDGDLYVRIKLRKDDELQEHAAHLNRTFLSLQDRVKRIHQYCRYTRETLEKLARQDSVTAQEKQQLDQLRELIRLIEEAVADFRV